MSQKRRTFNLLAGTSLLLLVLSIALWLRTCWRCDNIDLNSRRFAYNSYPHQLWFLYCNPPVQNPVFFQSGPVTGGFDPIYGPFFGFTRRSDPSGLTYTALGFSLALFGTPQGLSPRSTVIVAIPCWLPTGMAAVLPLIWLKRRLRPQVRGLCRSCGYDLRASPDRCPECGMVRQTME